MTTTVAAPAIDLLADNVAPAAPEVLAAVGEANCGLAAPYGEDRWTAALPAAFAAMLGAPTEPVVLPVGSGVAANAIALTALTRPGGVIYCHHDAHCRVAEHGAPEALSSCRMVPVDGDDDAGRLTPESLRATLRRQAPPPGSAISLTQLTEHGTAYRPEDLAALVAVAREYELGTHLDGARLAVAVAGAAGSYPAATATLATLTWQAGLDAVSFGCTKNGGLDADALLLFDPSLAERAVEARDRGAQRPSKLRFLAAQVLAYVSEPAWFTRAGHAHAMARRLAEELRSHGVDVVRPVHGNHVFAAVGDTGYRAHPWPQMGDGVMRLVTSWVTEAGDVERFVATVGPR